MNIKNYTSSVAASKSISMIEELLIDMGASHISKTYNEQKEIEAITFQIMIENKPAIIKLPSKVNEIYEVMIKSVSIRFRNKESVKKNNLEQAKRTAWKLLYEWTQIQFNMIELRQTTIAEIFLPYFYNLRTGKTFFQEIKENNYKHLQLSE